MSDAPDSVDLSVIVPLYNEEDNITLLYQTLTDVLRKLPYRYELLFVDDGSTDTTFRAAKQLAQHDPCLRVVRFRKNYGQTPAMAAGIDLARGRTLITMDGDLQNDPRDIPLFLHKIDQGYDIVVGWRHRRQDKLITRKIPSMIANRLIGKVTGVPIKDNGCSLKAYRAEVIKRIPLYNEMHRFIPAMASLSGCRIAEIKVNHHARRFGESKYGLSRIYKVILDLLTVKTLLALISHPLRWFGSLATVAGLIALAILALALVRWSQHGTSLVIFGSMAALFGALSVFLMSLGMLCEQIYSTGNFKLKHIALVTADIESLDEPAPLDSTDDAAPDTGNRTTSVTAPPRCKPAVPLASSWSLNGKH